MADQKSIEVKNLLINTENPRFALVKDQQSAIDTMLTDRRSNLKGLAKDIAENGLNPGELLYVAKENKKYIVLEGNRRLTAMKLITDPQLVRNNVKNKNFFQDLKDKYKDKYLNKLPSKLNCVVFNNKKDAEHWVKQRHTGENKGIGTVAWNAEQQERYRSQVTGLRSKPIQVLDFIRKHNIKYSGQKYTIIEKLIGTPYVREQIGINFNRKRELIFLDQNQENIVKNFEKVIKKIDAPNFSPVGTIDSKKARKKWINEVLGDQPSKKKTFKVENKRDIKKITKQKLTNNRDGTNLIPSDFTLNIPQERINSIYKELKSLSVKKYTNAVAVLFRVFLELSVDHFIENNKNKLNLNEKQKRTLKEKLENVAKYMESSKILTKNELKPIYTAIENQHDLSSINTFNSYVHNLNHTPITEYLKKVWFNYSKFIQNLWDSPKQ